MDLSQNGCIQKISSRSLDHFSIKTHGDMGIHQLKNPQIHVCIYIYMYVCICVPNDGVHEYKYVYISI